MERVHFTKSLVCEACKLPISPELLKILKKGQNNVYCVHCGNKIGPSLVESALEERDLGSFSSHIESQINIEQGTQVIFSQNCYKRAMLFLCRRSLQMFNDRTILLDIRREENYELHPIVLRKVANHFRTLLIKAILPPSLLKGLASMNQDRVRTCFKNLQHRIKNKKLYHLEYESFLQEVVNFTYRLYIGNQELSDLKGFELEIAKDLMGEFGFHYLENDSNANKIVMTNLFVEELYGTLIHPDCVLSLEQLKEETPLIILKQLANPLYQLVFHETIKEEWKQKLEAQDLYRFKAYYKQVSGNIHRNALYKHTFVEHLYWIIRTVIRWMTYGQDIRLKCTKGKGKEEFDVRHEYIKNYISVQPLFVKDPRFSEDFKTCLTKLLSRLIFISYRQLKMGNIPPVNITAHIESLLLNTLIMKVDQEGYFLKLGYDIEITTFLREFELFQETFLQNLFFYFHFMTIIKDLTRFIIKLLQKKGKRLLAAERTLYKDFQQLETKTDLLSMDIRDPFLHISEQNQNKEDYEKKVKFRFENEVKNAQKTRKNQKKAIIPKSKKFYYERLKSLIEKKNGTLLSSEYINAHTKVLVECEKEHQWWVTPNEIKKGSWCPTCYLNSKRMKFRKRVEKLIKEKGGFLKEIDYTYRPNKILVECREHHQWWTRVDSLAEGKWCKKCLLNKKGKYLRLREIIESKGGKLISKEYKNVKKKIWIECQNGHKWSVTPANIINGGTWCPKCHFEKLSKKFTKYTILDLKKIAKKKGGDCLEDAYLGWNENHQWTCSKNHIWSATPRNIFGNQNKPGTWCPICSESNVFERVCRGIMEEIFQAKFPKSSPHWLNIDKIGKKGGRRHLDGFNKKLRIAFECHGIQHYEYTKFFHKGDILNFHKQQKRDKLIRKLCKNNKVELIEIGYILEKGKNRRLKFNEIEDYIREQLFLKNIEVNKIEKSINWIEYISIHKKQDLILKLLIIKKKLTTSEIASSLKLSIKSTSNHLKALKSLDIVKMNSGKQNKKLWSINKRCFSTVNEKVKKINIDIINSKLEEIRPIESDILALLNKNGHLSAQEISKQLKYSVRTTQKYLKSLEMSDMISFKRKKGPGKSHPKLWYAKNKIDK